MKKNLIFLLSISLILIGVGCRDNEVDIGRHVVDDRIKLLEDFEIFKGEVESLRGVAGKEELIDEKIDSMGKGDFPLVQKEDLIFFYRGEGGEEVYLVSDLKDWKKQRMKRLDNTSLYYLQLKVDPLLSFEYKFLVDDRFKTDPLNSIKAPNYYFEETSYVLMGEHDFKGYWVKVDGIKGGNVEERSFNDINLSIYLPSDYHRNQDYPVIYFLGEEYLSYGDAQNTLDNLIDSGRLDEVIALFIPKEDILPYNHEERVSLILDDIVPYVADNYTYPKEQFIVSSSTLASLGAKASLEGEGIIDGLILQSPILDGDLLSSVEEGYNSDLRVYIDWGILNWSSNFNNTLDLLHRLEKSGYRYGINENFSGNGWANWREGLASALEYSFKGYKESEDKLILIEDDFTRDYPSYQKNIDNNLLRGERLEGSYNVEFKKKSFMAIDDFKFKDFSLELDFKLMNSKPFALILKGEEIYTLLFDGENLSLLEGDGEEHYRAKHSIDKGLIRLKWQVEGDKLALYLNGEKLTDSPYSKEFSNYLSFFGEEGAEVSIENIRIEERLD